MESGSASRRRGDDGSGRTYGWVATIGLVAIALSAVDLLVLHNQSRVDTVGAWLLFAGAVLGATTVVLSFAFELLFRSGPTDNQRWKLVLLLLAALLFLTSAVGLALAARHRVGTPSETEQPSSAGIDEGPEASFRCGTDRWPVKTLSDPAAGQVSLQARRSSVPELSRLTPPPRIGPNLQRQPFERQAYAINVRLKLVRYVGGRREDRDIHLVVQGVRGGPTMIVEFPDPACPGAAGSPHRALLLDARTAFEQACHGRPPQRFIALGGRARIEGVGFWDRPHGRDSPRGRAPNSAELHPVTRFAMASGSVCRRVP